MLRTIHRCLILSFFLLANNASATDLLEVFSLAESSDPVYRQSLATFNAIMESKPQARSQLLPQATLSATTSSNDQEISTSSGFGGSGRIGFNSHGYSLDISQPVFHLDRWLTLKQADSIIQQAQIEADAALQDLIIRVAESYFNVLAAQDNLEFARAEKTSLSRQLEQAKQRFEVGLTAITDVQEAQAGYDRSVANEILAENSIDNASEALREITGNYFSRLAELGNTMPLIKPEPTVIDEWTLISQQQNLRVIAAQSQLETARQEINIQRSGHLPTLDIVASKAFNSTGGRFGGTSTHSDAIGLELSVPLYSGGLVSSQTREARYIYDRNLEQLEQQYRLAQRQTREAFLGVISGISQVQAFNQSVISSETALEATRAGFEVGTRTTVDVVASQRVLLQAKRDYSRARYDYLLNTLRLKQAAGTLSPEDLNIINNWLDN